MDDIFNGVCKENLKTRSVTKQKIFLDHKKQERLLHIDQFQGLKVGDIFGYSLVIDTRRHYQV